MPPPNVEPVNISITSVPRTRRGEYSFVRATVIGSAPDMPRPARKRNMISSSIECAHTAARLNTPKTSVPRMIAKRRPNLSESTPNSGGPKKPANRLALNSGPSCERSRFHSLTSVGATKAAALMSKPSATWTRKHHRMTVK